MEVSMRIGTRKSTMALAQTEDIVRRLSATAPDLNVEIETVGERPWVLNGHSNSPIARHSTIDGAQMSLTASVLDQTGGQFIEVSRSGPAGPPQEHGRGVGLELLDKGVGGIIARTPLEP